MNSAMPIALTIAGSDSGAGAGIQADLKTFAAHEVYGTSVITAVTAQNTLGVTAIEEVSVLLVEAQIDAIAEDLQPVAVKTGMLSSADIIRAVAARVRRHGLNRLVVDPVMVATSGDRLLHEDAVEALIHDLVPLALILTPNAAEAAVLAGMPVRNIGEAEAAAILIHDMGPEYVLITGGHFGAEAVDVLFDGRRFLTFSAPRVPTTSTHGTGCTFSSAIAAGLAHRLEMEDAVSRAKEYTLEAIRRAFPAGAGHGPLNHFYRWWESTEEIR